MGVTLNRAMEIARLEVSTQQHLERMQETAKGEFTSSMENPPSPRRGRSHNLVQGASSSGGQVATMQRAGHRGTQIQWKIQQKTSSTARHPATDVEKEDTKRHRTAKLWMLHAEDVVRKDIMRKFA